MLFLSPEESVSILTLASGSSKPLADPVKSKLPPLPLHCQPRSSLPILGLLHSTTSPPGWPFP